MKNFWFITLATLALFGFARPTQEDSTLVNKVHSQVLKSFRTQSRIPILVVLKEQADLSGADVLQSKDQRGTFVYNALRTTALKSQNALISLIESKQLDYRAFYIVNMIAVYDATSELVAELIERDDVEKIYENATVKVKLPKPISKRPFSIEALLSGLNPTGDDGIGDNLTSVNADKVWAKYTKGEGIVVAGQDTGVQYDHPALKQSYRGFSVEKSGEAYNHDYNWHDSITKPIGESKVNKCGYNLKAPCDDDEHGSHTMGTMLGDDRGLNQIGMAPRAKWMACRNMDAGNGNPASYIECFEYFLAPYVFGGNPMKDGDPTKAPHIINNSWGCPSSEGCQGGEILPVLIAMKKAGILVVASAGNDGPGCATINDQPASHTEYTLSVGAHNHRTGVIASFSSRGPSLYDNGIGPDVTAPGVDIRSSIPGSAYAGTMWSGTSMAGPHVVGEVALMWSANPKLIGNIDKTISIVRASSIPKTATESCGGISGSSIPNNTYGYGQIDALKAVEMAIQAN